MSRRGMQAWVVALALFARALLPVGMMPVPAGTSSLFELVICTAGGLQVIAGASGDAPIQHHPQHHDCPCIPTVAVGLPDQLSLQPPAYRRLAAGAIAWEPSAIALVAHHYRSRAPPLPAA